MKRYRKANEEIRPDEALNAKAAEASSAAPRRVIALVTAAALLVGALTATAIFLSRDPADDLPPVTTDAPIETDAPADTDASADPVTPTDPVSPETAVSSPAALPLQLTSVSYPAQVQYPTDDPFGDSEAFTLWREAAWARRNQPACYNDGLYEASVALMQTLLPATEATAGTNRVISPLNIYLALAMLTETTDTTSRAALLELLGADSIEILRQRVASTWITNYIDDGRLTSRLAASLWLRDGMTYRTETLDRLAKYHYAESYSGTMGSPELDRALQNWLNENTGNLLSEQANGISLDPETVMALATTIYYKAKWGNEFNPNATADGTFHAADGDQTAPFMHRSAVDSYYWGEGFGAVAQELGDGKMWLILPDEGVTPDELIAKGDIFTMTNSGWDNSKRLVVNLALPKFDVVSDMDLSAGLARLGLGELFDPARADFSPITEEADGIALSQAKHAARVKIDEEGCEAAAYTVLMMAGSAMPPKDEIDFVLDRPFIFIVTSEDNAILFAGVVETLQ